MARRCKPAKTARFFCGRTALFAAQFAEIPVGKGKLHSRAVAVHSPRYFTPKQYPSERNERSRDRGQRTHPRNTSVDVEGRIHGKLFKSRDERTHSDGRGRFHTRGGAGGHRQGNTIPKKTWWRVTRPAAGDIWVISKRTWLGNQGTTGPV